MWDQDAALVLLPSRTRRAYLLARRRQRSLPATQILKRHDDLLHRTRGGDNDLLAGHDLVLVDYIVGKLHGHWSMAILEHLRRRDTWTLGADRYTDMLEAREQSATAQRRASMIDDFDHRAGDAWRSYQARTGQRNQRASRGSAHIVHAGVL
jgi:hypothetical protein